MFYKRLRVCAIVTRNTYKFLLSTFFLKQEIEFTNIYTTALFPNVFFLIFYYFSFLSFIK